MSDTPHIQIVARNVEEEMKESYLRYSLSVIISRALPDARDGLKPSQRRILYAMRALHLSPGAKHRKCAKICGDTSGDFHPHGETVIYPTLVRLAQSWNMRYCLIDGQGNFGSIDGDPAAAMRYTEARMTAAAMQLMEDLDKDTVDHVPNYDDTKMEPTVFPSKFPNLLCNGSSGIAVGMATNIPPHNFKELVQATLLVLDNPLVSIEEIMSVMPGPDFPTGGIICGQKGIKDAYETGRGKVYMRAVHSVEEGEKTRIIVTELPYLVNKARLVEHVADLVNNKEITGISDVRDESDKDGMRIVFELKRGEVGDVIANQLFKYTDMQTTFGCNMLALDKGMPKVMNVRQMIQCWITHRIEVIRRRTRFELAKAQARAHILEGFLKAVGQLDRVIAIIRQSTDREQAKDSLIQAIDLSQRQALAVLELRLYQLTALEQGKIEEEHKELLNKIAELQSILASEELVRSIIRTELQEMEKNHPSGRRSQIQPAEDDMSVEDLIADEPMILTISSDDYIKRMPVETFREQRRGGQGVMGFEGRKEGDSVKDLYSTSMHQMLLIFTEKGRCYWLKVWQVPEGSRRAKGKPIISMLEGFQEGEKIAKILCVPAFDAESFVLMTTRQGIVKKTELIAFSHPRKKGVNALVIDEGDELIAAHLVRPSDQVMLFTRQGMAVRFDEAQVRPMGRVARGVIGVRLKAEDDAVVAAQVVQPDDNVLVVCENGFGKRSLVSEYRQTNRGSSGVRSIVTSERNGCVVGAVRVVDEDSVLLMSHQGQTVRISMRDLRIIGRSTQGVKLIQLSSGDHVLVFQKIADNEADEDSKEQPLPPVEIVAESE